MGTVGIPNPAATFDTLSGLGTGTANFFKTLGNLPVEMPISSGFGVPINLRSFGVPLVFEYGQYQNLTQRMAGFQAEAILTVGSFFGGGGSIAAESATVRSGQVFQRVVCNAELAATESTNLLRGGRPGANFFTNAASLDAKRAQIRLGLDGPLRDQRITFGIVDDTPVFGPTRAKMGQSGTNGGGLEYFTNSPTRIEIFKREPLRK